LDLFFNIFTFHLLICEEHSNNNFWGKLSNEHPKWRSLAGGHPKLSHLLEDTLVTDNYAAGHRAPYFIHFHWLRRENSGEMIFLPLLLSSSSLPFSFFLFPVPATLSASRTRRRAPVGTSLIWPLQASALLEFCS